jgi:hypothetical protein
MVRIGGSNAIEHVKNTSRPTPHNPLKVHDSDERIQGIPRKTNTPRQGLSRRNGRAPRKPKSAGRTPREGNRSGSFEKLGQ